LGEALDEEMAGFLEPLPGLVFLGVADPDIEVAADPRAGMEVGGFGLGGVGIEVIADAAGLELGGGLERAIEGGEEAFAAVGEGFPGVLAVEDEGGDSPARGSDTGDVAEVLDEMLNGAGGLVARGIEADEIGERAFAEEGLDGGSPGVNAPALEELDVIGGGRA
jgi:hypothetical protein